jgi:acetaldehyde dehydrogenase/alcohol dehydrogenase
MLKPVPTVDTKEKIAPSTPPPSQDALADLQHLKGLIETASKAQEVYEDFSQQQVDAIFKAAAAAASAARISLAVLAVEETKMGLMEDKVIKNHFASEYIYNKYKDTKTCDVIEENTRDGIMKVAEPIGVIAGIVPTTNPTSTVIFKCLLALKTRNAIVLSPHVRAAKCSIEAARIIREAAEAAGSPKGLIQWIEKPSLALATALMKDPKINLILATGGPGMVKAAYESGHPSIGVGAGNTPAVIDATADIPMAVSSILISKTFDNGVICASEQNIIAEEAVYDEVVAELKLRGAYFMTPQECKKAGATILKDGRLNADVVGQKATALARLFGFEVPPSTKVLIGEATHIGQGEPMSYEKLCPVLGLYKAKDWTDAIDKARRLVEFGGHGHTSCLYTSIGNKQHVNDFQDAMETVRILINSPASQGAIGDLYNFHLDPSLTLGCGSWGSTSVSANVGPQHLINVKTVAMRQENMLWFKAPPKIYFKRNSLDLALQELKGFKRAFIVTDPPLFELGLTNQIVEKLLPLGIQPKTFTNVEPDPTLGMVERALVELRSFKPDVIIAIGGGSPMDAAKLMWLMYEHPDIKFEDVAARFMDIRKRINAIPALGKLAQFVAIPTTSGTGSEVTPFAVVTDEKTGIKYPLADYALVPNMAICDANLVDSMPKRLTAYGGLDALVHALESYVSVCATDYTRGLSLQAIKLCFQYLPRSYKNGAADPIAREKMHNAATIAGMAFANAFLGICHSMAHKLGGTHHVPHGLANALLITHVIRYNATDKPFKQTCFPQYAVPDALNRYAEVADALALGGTTKQEKVIKLIEAVEKLKAECDVPPTIKQVMGDKPETEWFYMSSTLDMSYQAFDDQCTGANPRYPLVKDLRKMFEDAWDKPVLPLSDLEFVSPASSCLKSRLEAPHFPAGLGAA